MQTVWRIGVAISLFVYDSSICSNDGCLSNHEEITAPASRPEPRIEANQGQPKRDLITFDGVVADIVANLDDAAKARIRNSSQGERLKMHFGLGLYIRNEYRLWSNEALLSSCARRLSPKLSRLDPDDASMVIIEGVWEVLRKRR